MISDAQARVLKILVGRGDVSEWAIGYTDLPDDFVKYQYPLRSSIPLRVAKITDEGRAALAEWEKKQEESCP